jgi:hypothetical protein
MKRKVKSYVVELPVFKQGDDLAHHLSQNGFDPIKAFAGLAEQYQFAAAQCQDIAAQFGELTKAEIKKVSVQADTHSISVEMPEKLAAGLLKEELISLAPWDEEEYEE